MVCATSTCSNQPAKSDQSICESLDYSMTVKVLIEHRLEFLNIKGGCTGSSASTVGKNPHCWKSHVKAHLSVDILSPSIWAKVKGISKHPFQIEL